MADEVEEVEEVDTTTWWEDFRDYYLSFDRRTLGLARVFIGIFALSDLFRRTADWFDMYSNSGVLPTHYNLWRPQSSGFTLFNAFATHGELIALWLVGFTIFTCLLLGYKTKVAQVCAAIFVASMNGRVLLIENGGYVVHNLLFLWTAFLPLGDRFSLDAWLKSMRTQKERNAVDLNDRSTDVAHWRLDPFVSFVGIVILLQLSAIYGFNVVHKTGRAWHDGTAVHYVLYVDRMVNPLIGYAREHTPWIILLMLTKSVMGMEAGLPVALLSPLARVWAKRIAIIFVNLLHIGFGSTFVLGPFAWALCCFSVLLFSPEDWELVSRTMRRRHRRRTVRYNPGSAAAFFWCRVIKRCDRFELLKFRADRKADRLEVTTPDKRRITGPAAKVHIVSAFPGGPLFAWMFYGLAYLAPATEALFGLGKRDRKLETVPAAGYQPELKDDFGHERVDSYFIIDWFRDHYGETNRIFATAVTLLFWAIGVGLLGWAAFSLSLMGLKYAKLLGLWRLSWGASVVAMAIPVFLVYRAQKQEPGFLKNAFESARPWAWWKITGALTFVGAFLTIYGNPMMKRLQIDASVEMLSGFPRGVVVFWGGLALLIVAFGFFTWPLLRMNLTTPSPGKRKLFRSFAYGRELLILMFFCGAVNQSLVELWIARPLKAPQPSPIRELSHKMRYLQGWFMFSPNPVMDDGTIVVDAITVDNRRVDPFTIGFPDYTLREPIYDLLNAKSYWYNQIWSDYFNRMHMPANTAFRKPMKEYMYRLPERTGDPDDAIVKGVVYWVHDMNPKWGTTNSYSYNRKELFKFSNPDPDVQKRWREQTGGIDPPELPLPVEPPRPRAKKKPGKS